MSMSSGSGKRLEVQENIFSYTSGEPINIDFLYVVKV